MAVAKASWQVRERDTIVAILAEVGNSFKNREVNVRTHGPALYVSFANFDFGQ